MYAIVKISNQQFRVEPEAQLRVPLLAAEPGAKVTFDDVLLCSDGDQVRVGTPRLEGCTVAAEVLRHGLGAKVLVFKKKRRKNYRRTKGHRQDFTEIKITGITAG